MIQHSSVAPPRVRLLAALCALALVLAAPRPVASQEPSGSASAASSIPADAYADAAARELVHLARLRRSTVDRRIEAYEARAVERVSVKLRTPIGERLIFRRETVADIAWTPDTVRVELQGVREVLPPLSGSPQLPAGLAASVPSLAFDPLDSELLLRFDDRVLRHPLATGSEQHYRFASGETTTLRLPTGHTIRLRELRISPRRADRQLISGSFWLDEESYAVVQAYFRLAGAVEAPRGAVSLSPPTSAELDFIAVNYGIWEQRWWMPHTVAAQGMVRAGNYRLPVTYERRYEGYVIRGDAAPLPRPDLAQVPGELPARLCRPRTGFSVQARIGAPSPLDTLSAEGRALREARQDSVRRAHEEQTDSAEVCDRTFLVTRAEDPTLLESELLSGDIYADASPVLSPAELRAIAERMGAVPRPVLGLSRPVVEWPLNRPGLIRYNRVEGLSAGVGAAVTAGPLGADLALRAGANRAALGGELGVRHAGARLSSRLAGYHRLEATPIASDPFSVRASAAALLLGRDDNDYFRASGVELLMEPAGAGSRWYDLRLFAERQSEVPAQEEFSVARLLGRGPLLRPNVEALRGEQVGATLRLRAARGLDPEGPRLGAELELHGEVGDHRFARPALRVRASTQLLPRVTLGAEGATGVGLGEVPPQRMWQLGGAETLRGHDFGAARGDAFWLARGEVGYGLPFLRFLVFGDVGDAGPTQELPRGAPLRSAGLGLGLFDGMIRAELARAVETGAWRAYLRLNGAF
jgi:hypothetical protein